MSFISNVRNRMRQNVYIKQNDAVFNDYLKNDLSRDDLENVMGMMSHSEVHIPLMNHADALLRQTNFDSELRKQFVESLNKLPANELRDEVIAKASIEDDTLSSNSLSSNLNVVDRTPKESLTDKLKQRIKDTYNAISKESLETKLKQRIHDTYNAISERVEARTDKMKAPFIKARDKTIAAYQKTTTALTDSGRAAYNKMADSGRNVYNNAAPVVDMISDRARDRLLRVKDEFRTRKLTYQNDANFAKALSNGVSFETLNEGLNNFEYPEIRYALMNNAESMFKQDAMTPELAANLYLAAEPYLDNNKLSNKFIEAFNNYAETVELPDEAVEKTDEAVEKTISVKYKDLDVKYTTLTGFTNNGETQWEMGDNQTLSEDEFLNNLMSQYDAEMYNADVILPPNVNDDAYFENLSSNFDKELSEEDALMSHSQGVAFLDDLNLQVSQKDMPL